MLRRLLGSALAGTLALAVAACDNPNNGTVARANGGEPASPTVADIGDPLYPDAPAPKPPVAPAEAQVAGDPIVIRQCQVTHPQTQNVPSKNDGRLLVFCT